MARSNADARVGITIAMASSKSYAGSNDGIILVTTDVDAST